MTDNPEPLILARRDGEHHEPPLTIDQAAHYLNVEIRRVRRAVFECRIPYYKVGRFIRFDPADLDRFLRESRVPARGATSGRRVS